MADFHALTEPTEFLDSDASAVRNFAALLARKGRSARDSAVDAYYAVRDGLRYEIYSADLSRPGLRASATIQRGSGLCIHKSIVYATVLRALGIPSRLVFVDVRNHLASPQLRAHVGGEVFHYHCMVSVRLDGAWVRATPVFNLSLCRLFSVRPLEFDGQQDSIYQAYNGSGQSHMQIVHEHGEFDDVPYDWLLLGLQRAHPGLFASPVRFRGGAIAGDGSRAARTARLTVLHASPDRPHVAQPEGTS